MTMTLDTGLIERTDKGFVVRRKGAAYLAKESGVVCENPAAAEADRIYAKFFENPDKQIYLPDQYDLAVAQNLTGKNVIRLGANGYSKLTPERCAAWGIQPGAYEAACFGLLSYMYEALCADFPGVDIRFVNGASNVGIDKVLIQVAQTYNRYQLGHSCPGFMFYVDPDDGVPVYVGATKEQYADAFIRSLNILVACNGGEQAFVHDISAMFRHKRHLIPVNVIRSISTCGGPPAVVDGRVEDAVAAFEQHVHTMTQALYQASDPYLAITRHVTQAASQIARRQLVPSLAFAAIPAQMARQA